MHHHELNLSICNILRIKSVREKVHFDMDDVLWRGNLLQPSIKPRGDATRMGFTHRDGQTLRDDFS